MFAHRTAMMAPGSFRHLGFTLIELMLAVAVIAILSAIAIPSFQEHMVRSKRSAAQADMMAMQLAQERYRANKSCFAANGEISMPSNEHYTYRIVDDTSTECPADCGTDACQNQFTIVAEATGSQAVADAKCKFMKTTQGDDKCASETDTACPATTDTNGDGSVNSKDNDPGKCWKS